MSPLFDSGITVVNSGANAGIYVGGTASYSTLGGVGQWVVRKSGDGGSSWSTVDKYTYNGVNGASSFGLASDAAGNVFATGNAGSSAGGHWVTRQTSNGGGSWSTIDDWQYAAGQSTTSRAVGFDGNGNLITVGGSGGHALARTLVNGTWTVVDDYVGGSYTSVGTDNLGYTYAAGTSTGSSQWIVRDPPPSSSVFSDVVVGKHHGKHRHH